MTTSPLSIILCRVCRGGRLADLRAPLTCFVRCRGSEQPLCGSTQRHAVRPAHARLRAPLASGPRPRWTTTLTSTHSSKASFLSPASPCAAAARSPSHTGACRCAGRLRARRQAGGGGGCAPLRKSPPPPAPTAPRLNLPLRVALPLQARRPRSPWTCSRLRRACGRWSARAARRTLSRDSRRWSSRSSDWRRKPAPPRRASPLPRAACRLSNSAAVGSHGGAAAQCGGDGQRQAACRGLQLPRSAKRTPGRQGARPRPRPRPCASSAQEGRVAEEEEGLAEGLPTLVSATRRRRLAAPRRAAPLTGPCRAPERLRPQRRPCRRSWPACRQNSWQWCRSWRRI